MTAYTPWTPADEDVIRRHPEMTAKALARLLGRSYESVRRKRTALGGRNAGMRLCCVCGMRPVWQESKAASKMGLCRGCYNDEAEARALEEADCNRRRQAVFKARHNL